MDQAQPVGRIDVISDVICPWCYIGKRQLERALDLLEKQVDVAPKDIPCASWRLAAASRQGATAPLAG